MKKVYLCANALCGDVPGNIELAKQYAKYVFECGAAPVVPAFYALILDYGDPSQRELCINAGLSMLWMTDEVWVFGDRITRGMKAEIKLAKALNIKIRYIGRRNQSNGGSEFYEKKKGY